MSISLLALAANAAPAAQSYAEAVKNQKMLSSKSWIDFTSVTDVEPIVLVDSDIRHEKIMPEIMQSMLRLYTSYYLRAASLLSNLGSVEMLRRLDSLNPNRKMSDSIYSSAITEGVYNAAAGGIRAAAGSMESAYHSEEDLPPYMDYEYFAPVPSTSVSLEADSLQGQKNTDLIAGTTAKVVFKEDQTEFPVHVSFRLAPYVEDTNVIRATFAIGSQRNTPKERRHRYKSGELSFADRFFLRDIIKSHRNAMIKSKTSFYQDTLRRRSNQQATNFVKGGGSTAEISGGIIISKRTAIEVERELEGKLDDFAVRENALDKVSAMVLIVVDPDNEEMTIYRYSVREVIHLDFASIKDYNTRGPDMMDLMKSINFARR